MKTSYIYILCVVVLLTAIVAIWQHQRDMSSPEAETGEKFIPGKTGKDGKRKTPLPPKTPGLPPPSGPEIVVGSWTNQFQKLPKEILDIRISGGALTVDRSVSPVLKRILQLTNEEEIKVNKSLAHLFAQAETKTPSRVEPVPGKEGVFRIKADPEEAEKTMKDFYEKLATDIGAKRGQTLIDCLDIYRMYGAFGALDVEVTFEDKLIGNPADPSPSMQVRYTMTSPTTGAFLTGGGGLFDDFTRMFGKETFTLQDRN